MQFALGGSKNGTPTGKRVLCFMQDLDERTMKANKPKFRIGHTPQELPEIFLKNKRCMDQLAAWVDSGDVVCVVNGICQDSSVFNLLGKSEEEKKDVIINREQQMKDMRDRGMELHGRTGTDKLDLILELATAKDWKATDGKVTEWKADEAIQMLQEYAG